MDAFKFIGDMVSNKGLIFELTMRDFKSKYLGSYLGLIWAFINPMVYVVILWFVFYLGFKSSTVGKVSFFHWLIAGIVPWFFISDSLSSAAHSIVDYSFLVKKVVFRISLLPLVRILSALYVHLFFLVLVLLIYFFSGYSLDWHVCQLPYYLFAAVVFVTGVSWITSSVTIFFRDMGQIVNMLLQFLFWLTPIFWQINIIPAKFVLFLKLNPVFYIVNGYRNSLINRVWFWEEGLLSIYFWIVVAFVFFTGAFLFRRLRPHFADVI
ncbi:ABC transporter permease [Candidatus Magnetomonas plexicatena]|uniref:ABC transporter permease n=1 Tax=Candidatus Magnetomonas plexicatena TaxID=2552947 RepID=UPI004032CE6A